MKIKQGPFKGLTIDDLRQIADFHKIIKNYLKMIRLLEKHN